MKLTSLNEVLDAHYGPKGTPERDRFEREAMMEANMDELADAVKTARSEQKLTQKQLAEKAGVNSRVISLIENSGDVCLRLVYRVLDALGKTLVPVAK